MHVMGFYALVVLRWPVPGEYFFWTRFHFSELEFRLNKLEIYSARDVHYSPRAD